MHKCILVTGGRGFLGRNLLQALAESYPDAGFRVLARSDEAQADLLKWFGRMGADRFQVIRGDILQAGLGLSVKESANLSGVSEVWHIAASTSFDEREKEAIYQGNVVGTQNALALSESLPKLENFFYISTAYVAGLNAGPVAEDEMPPCVGFRNTYEASKWEAEKTVRESGLPFTVFRPSIIMGHSQTLDSQCERRMIYGYVLGIYCAVLKDCKRQQINFPERWAKGEVLDLDVRLLGHHNTAKNFVCIDDVTQSILGILQQPHTGKTFHLTSASPICGRSIATGIEQALKITGMRQGGDKIDDPTPLERTIMNFTAPFVPYTTRHDPIWRLDNTNAALGAAQRKPMDEDLFARLVDHFVRNAIFSSQNTSQADPGFMDPPITAVA
jgi:nucleoside-diphosphate-sugar epimerase